MENIPKTTFLELAQGGYMSRAENLILVGNPGLGKTHLAIGLALAACRQAKRVRFYKTAALINDLQVSQKKLTLSGFVARFVKLDLLVLDELGFIAVDKAGGQLLFQLVSDLYEQVSMIITSNLRFGDWNSIFADATLTTAFLDRLTHKGRIIPTNVVSMMINQSLLQQKRRNHRTPLPKNMWFCPITRSMGAWSRLGNAGLQPPMWTVP